MKIRALDDPSEGFKLATRGEYPAICLVNNLRFSDTEPLVNLEIDWICKGRYTNLQRKKMVQRTISSLLRALVNSERRKLKIRK